MKRFLITFHGEAELEVEDEVIDCVDDDWREELYDLETPGDIAAHIAYNVIFRHATLSSLDGWADQPDSNIISCSVHFCEVEGEEE